jgi:hypothetical protein
MQNSRSTLFSITAVLAVTVTLLFLGGGVDAEVSLEKMTQNCLLLENEVAMKTPLLMAAPWRS